jgi:hypothetical protein
MISLFKTNLLIFLLTSIIHSFEFGVHSKGIEFGFLDHRHFKLLTSCEGFYTLDGLSSVRASVTPRWFNFERSVFRLHCLSGVYLQYYRLKKEYSHYHYSNYEMLAFGVRVFDLEPSVMFNERISLFIRCSLFNINLLPRKWISAGMYELQNDASRALVNSSSIGIRIRFYKRNTISGEN